MLSRSFFQISNNHLLWHIFLTLLLVLRVVLIAVSPLALGGDEAQYWQWSTTPDWGYFSKPPLIAWLIALTTAVFGDSEFGVRVALPFLHGITAWFLWLSARHLWPQTRATAIWAVAIYLLMPGVFLSSFLMTTDALLLPLAAIAVYAFLRANSAQNPVRWLLLLAFALGLGLLAKYAMLFLIAGFILIMVFDKQVRQVFFGHGRWLVFLLPVFMVAPNIWWNQTHGFATFSHTADNIKLQAEFSLDAIWPQIIELVSFLLDQLAVFGPISLLLLVAAIISGIASRQNNRVLFQLVILCLVVFAIISTQALLSRAHANWAVIAYVPGTLVLAGFISTYLRAKILALALALQLVIGGIGMYALAFPQKFMDTDAGSALEPLTGWSETADKVMSAVHASEKDNLVAIVTDTRLFHYSLAWQLRNTPHPPLRMWSRYANPHSHRELMQPLLLKQDDEVLLVISRPRFQPRVLADFKQSRYIKTIQIDLGGGQIRRAGIFKASGFNPQKRDQDYEDRWQYLDDISD